MGRIRDVKVYMIELLVSIPLDYRPSVVGESCVVACQLAAVAAYIPVELLKRLENGER